MNFKFATSLLVLSLVTDRALAVRGVGGNGDQDSSLRGEQGGRQGEGSHGGPRGHHNGKDRPFSGGPHGIKPGFPGSQIQPDLTEITCSTDYDCALPNGEDGTFVCRGLYHPITGESKSKAICIPNDRAWVTDECGCCGEDCPEQPEFVDLTCEDEEDQTLDSVAVSRAADHQGGPFSDSDVDMDIVCRNLVNPFTGEETPTTIPVPVNRGLDGDTCGCCDGVCPKPGEQKFPRPDLTDITCEAEDLITCELPKRGGKNGDDTDSQDSAVFVCREMYNPLTGVSKQEAVCIPPDRAWETDTCGCCGEDCPERPAPVEIDCEEAEQSCDLRSGEEGVFVCRSVFHPLDGQVEERSLCIPSDRAWVTDTCGCCESGCPTTPEGGFDDEDTQLYSMALEAPEEYALDEVANDDSSEASNAIIQCGATMTFLVAIQILML